MVGSAAPIERTGQNEEAAGWRRNASNTQRLALKIAVGEGGCRTTCSLQRPVGTKQRPLAQEQESPSWQSCTAEPCFVCPSSATAHHPHTTLTSAHQGTSLTTQPPTKCDISMQS